MSGYNLCIYIVLGIVAVTSAIGCILAIIQEYKGDQKANDEINEP